jgi:hypothetical protein
VKRQIARPSLRAVPQALSSRNPFAWLTFFGPGAVIASLTIGAGELIFSSRAGSIFGYRLLWFFVLVLALKWVLAFATARHMVLTGAHPFNAGWNSRSTRLVSGCVLSARAGLFSDLGQLSRGHPGHLAVVARRDGAIPSRGAYLVWGMIILAVVLILVSAGGYDRLEKIQLIIVGVMLACVVVSLFLLNPQWIELLKGLLVPQMPAYPSWITEHAEVAARPVWVETITYVGVLGGSGYDYLAYVSYLRAKHWGRAGRDLADANELAAMARDPNHADRKWLRALWIDSVLSFLAVLIFAGVFVACGAMVLGPQHKVPGGNNLLQLQAEFISPLYPWLKPLYFAGAFLAIFGTLYGTIEVAPAILRELARAFHPASAKTNARRLRFWAVLWVSVGGASILIWTLASHLARNTSTPPGLIALLTPANLFTGVLACGIICVLSWWADRRYLPRALWLRWPLRLLNLFAAMMFLTLGLKAYWDHSGWIAYLLLVVPWRRDGFALGSGNTFEPGGIRSKWRQRLHWNYFVRVRAFSKLDFVNGISHGRSVEGVVHRVPSVTAKPVRRENKSAFLRFEVSRARPRLARIFRDEDAVLADDHHFFLVATEERAEPDIDRRSCSCQLAPLSLLTSKPAAFPGNVRHERELESSSADWRKKLWSR